MIKKILSLTVSCLLLWSAALPAFAREEGATQKRTVLIVNAKALERLAENCRLDSYSVDLVVDLQSDLDLSNSDFRGIPIFCGEFQGNGHTIRGLDLTREGSQQGFFRYLTNTAVVQDLHLMGSVEPAGTGSQVGGFAGQNSGIIRNCSFAGMVSARDQVGGIAGENTVTGLIENCETSGTITGGHFTGGIAGKNAGTIRTCENRALINETAWQNELELSDITLDTMVHSEAANTVTDVGGIAGINAGFIRNCINQANIGHPSMGYNIGGIAGTQSGTVWECENRGEIFGRKDVGGIAGQMEPSAVMTFQEDALQILSRQLDGMGQAVSKASANLQGSGEKMLNQMGSMHGYIHSAMEAVGTLMPDPANPQTPDQDTLQAAKNNIASSLSGMSQVMQGVGATAYSLLGKVSSNLHAINDQMNAMRATIGNISETLGGSVIDRSDEDTVQDLTGKVAHCKNYGSVQADLNCGGIAGAISMENDMDLQEDWTVQGENSLNFETELRAVILECENQGRVTAKKQNAGGIAGHQAMGLVKDSINTGILHAQKADYVGGISGRSTGFIRSCHANTVLSGSSYVGGIAGAAAVASDCYGLVKIDAGVEKLGAILGSIEENQTDIQSPIAGNYYLVVKKDPGAIDGISYSGQAQPMQEAAFFQLENLPASFREVEVTFRYNNGTERSIPVDFGQSFPEEWIPPIPPKEGRRAYWEGLTQDALSGVFFDAVFEQAYTDGVSVVESTMKRNEIPVLLVQGAFSEEAAVRIQTAQQQPPLENGELLLEAWDFQCTEPDRQTQIRIHLSDGTDDGSLRLLIRGADQTWREESYDVMGRYGVAPLVSGDDAVALIQSAGTPWLIWLTGAMTLLVVSGIYLVRKKQRKQ